MGSEKQQYLKGSREVTQKKSDNTKRQSYSGTSGIHILSGLKFWWPKFLKRRGFLRGVRTYLPFFG
jgi:hypothetical protein